MVNYGKDDCNLLKKYETNCTNIEDVQNIKLDALPAYDNRYIWIKLKTYDDKVNTIFRGLMVLEDGVELM